MTETIATGSKKTLKHTCQECHRTVYVITLEDGSKIFVDPEIITVVPYRLGTHLEASIGKKIAARRSHSELCLTYQLQNERAKLKAKAARRGLRK